MEIVQLEDGIKIPVSKTKNFLLWMGCVAFVSLAIWMLFFTNALLGEENDLKRIVFWLCIFFFGLGVIGFPVVLFHKKSGLYISSKGINIVSPLVKSPEISWSEIEGFSEFDMNRTKLLMVVLKNPYDYLNRLSSFGRFLGESSMRISGSPYGLTANSFKCSFAELKEVLQANFEKYK